MRCRVRAGGSALEHHQGPWWAQSRLTADVTNARKQSLEVGLAIARVPLDELLKLSSVRPSRCPA